MTAPNRKQTALLHILLKEVGLNDDAKRAYYRRVTCRQDVTSSREMSAFEVGQVIDDLLRFKRDEPNLVGEVAA